MTPCEKMGYKVGDEFIITGCDREQCHHFAIGSRVKLTEDDGSDRPEFKKGRMEQWVCLHDVKPAQGCATITRANGEPFATESSARQQLAAKGLQDTHEVVPHEGGYALAPINRDDDPITTLKKARQARDEAEQAYQAAFHAVRHALGDGFTLSD